MLERVRGSRETDVSERGVLKTYDFVYCSYEDYCFRGIYHFAAVSKAINANAVRLLRWIFHKDRIRITAQSYNFWT